MTIDLMQLFPQLPLTTFGPSWFYLFSGLVYLLTGAISLFISYFSFKLFNISCSKSHALLSVSFLLIGIAFAILSFTSFYTYQNSENLDADLFNLNVSAYNIYDILSLTAYLFLVIIYLPKKKDPSLYAVVPLWFMSSAGVHSASLLFLMFIAAKTVLNFFKVKSEESFLVMFAFLMIILSHIFLLLIPFGIELYLVAHAFLITGFLSFLLMLIRVTRKC